MDEEKDINLQILRETASELARLRRTHEVVIGRVLAKIGYRLREIEKEQRGERAQGGER